MTKIADSHIITTHSIILKMPSQFCSKNRPPCFRLACIAYRLQPFVHLLDLDGEFLAVSFPSYLEVTLSAFITEMGKPQKAKTTRLTSFLSAVFSADSSSPNFANLSESSDSNCSATSLRYTQMTKSSQ